MWLIYTLLILGILYIGVGCLVQYVNAKSRDDDFKLDWMKIIKWPKFVFGG